MGGRLCVVVVCINGLLDEQIIYEKLKLGSNCLWKAKQERT